MKIFSKTGQHIIEKRPRKWGAVWCVDNLNAKSWSSRRLCSSVKKGHPLWPFGDWWVGGSFCFFYKIRSGE